MASSSPYYLVCRLDGIVIKLPIGNRRLVLRGSLERNDRGSGAPVRRVGPRLRAWLDRVLYLAVLELVEAGVELDPVPAAPQSITSFVPSLAFMVSDPGPPKSSSSPGIVKLPSPASLSAAARPWISSRPTMWSSPSYRS
jgi:hypothetical protein